MRLSRKKLFAIFILAVLARLALFAVFVNQKGSFDFILGPQDTGSFINDARNLYSGNGFSDAAAPPFLPDGIRVPVVPAILGLFGNNFGWYVISQILAASFTCVFLADLGARFFGQKAGLLSGLLLALDPLVIFHSLEILSETWFSFFLVLAVWWLAKFWEGGSAAYRWLIAAAAVLGAATLARPVGIVIFLAFVLALLFADPNPWLKRLRNVMIFTAVVGAVVSPWLIRNHATFGTWGLSYIPAYNWYHFNARVFYAKIHNIPKAEAKIIFNAREEEERAKQNFNNGFQMQGFYLRQAKAAVSEAPGKYLVFHGLNTAAVFFTGTLDGLKKALNADYRDVDLTSYVWRGWEGLKDLYRDYPGELAAKLLLLLSYLVVFCGFLLAFPQREVRRRFVFLAGLVFLLAATTGAVAEGRFRVPVEPFIILLFVYSASVVYSVVNPRFSRTSRV